ncbi:MAG: hypothetical protein PHV97_03025, partial [Candidatus Omnitrophica bacterium]|nr:hypothetical protein [Candidatus Omnitrophota bacterium]
HIQNAHANYQAQMKIKQLLGYMNKKYGFKTIFVEGASEKLDADYLRLFPDQERNLKLCDELARQGELTGAELYLMEADKSVAGLPIEQAALYKSNYEALKKVFGAETDVARFFKGFDGKLDKVASKTFTPETRELIADWKRFEQGRRDFMPFVQGLAKKSKKILKVDLESLFAQVGWPQISRLLVIQQLEKDLNKTKGVEEQAALITDLRAKGVSKELLATLQSFGEGNIAVGKSTTEISPREVLERLSSEAGPKGFKFSDYPAFSLYAGYITLRSELDPKVLFEEIGYLFTQMLDTLVQEPQQKALLTLYRDGELLRKLLHLELNRTQWRQLLEKRDQVAIPSLVERLKEAVQTTDSRQQTTDRSKKDLGLQSPVSGLRSVGDVMPPAFGKKMDELFTAGLEFYDFAHKREAVFYKKMQGAMTESKITKAILITGGFHTDGMSDLFRENAISYGIVTPRLSEKSDEHLYRTTMLQGREQLFSISYLEMAAKLMPLLAQVDQGVDVSETLATIFAQFMKEGKFSDMDEALGVFNQSVAAKAQGINLENKGSVDGKFNLKLVKLLAAAQIQKAFRQAAEDIKRMPRDESFEPVVGSFNLAWPKYNAFLKAQVSMGQKGDLSLTDLEKKYFVGAGAAKAFEFFKAASVAARSETRASTDNSATPSPGIVTVENSKPTNWVPINNLQEMAAKWGNLPGQSRSEARGLDEIKGDVLRELESADGRAGVFKRLTHSYVKNFSKRVSDASTPQELRSAIWAVTPKLPALLDFEYELQAIIRPVVPAEARQVRDLTEVLTSDQIGEAFRQASVALTRNGNLVLMRPFNYAKNNFQKAQTAGQAGNMSLEEIKEKYFEEGFTGLGKPDLAFAHFISVLPAARSEARGIVLTMPELTAAVRYLMDPRARTLPGLNNFFNMMSLENNGATFERLQGFAQDLEQRAPEIAQGLQKLLNEIRRRYETGIKEIREFLDGIPSRYEAEAMLASMQVQKAFLITAAVIKDLPRGDNVVGAFDNAWTKFNADKENRNMDTRLSLADLRKNYFTAEAFSPAGVVIPTKEFKEAQAAADTAFKLFASVAPEARSEVRALPFTDEQILKELPPLEIEKDFYLAVFEAPTRLLTAIWDAWRKYNGFFGDRNLPELQKYFSGPQANEAFEFFAGIATGTEVQRSETRELTFRRKMSQTFRDLVILGGIGVIALVSIESAATVSRSPDMAQVAASQIKAPTKVGFDSALNVDWLFDSKTGAFDATAFKKAFAELMKLRAERAKAKNLNLLMLSESTIEKTVSKASSIAVLRGLHPNGFLLEYIPRSKSVQVVDLDTTRSKSFQLPTEGAKLKDYLRKPSARSEMRSVSDAVSIAKNWLLNLGKKNISVPLAEERVSVSFGYGYPVHTFSPRDPEGNMAGVFVTFGNASWKIGVESRSVYLQRGKYNFLNNEFVPQGGRHYLEPRGELIVRQTNERTNYDRRRDPGMDQVFSVRFGGKPGAEILTVELLKLDEKSSRNFSLLINPSLDTRAQRFKKAAELKEWGVSQTPPINADLMGRILQNLRATALESLSPEDGPVARLGIGREEFVSNDKVKDRIAGIFGQGILKDDQALANLSNALTYVSRRNRPADTSIPPRAEVRMSVLKSVAMAAILTGALAGPAPALEILLGAPIRVNDQLSRVPISVYNDETNSVVVRSLNITATGDLVNQPMTNASGSIAQNLMLAPGDSVSAVPLATNAAPGRSFFGARAEVEAVQPEAASADAMVAEAVAPDVVLDTMLLNTAVNKAREDLAGIASRINVSLSEDGSKVEIRVSSNDPQFVLDANFVSAVMAFEGDLYIRHLLNGITPQIVKIPKELDLTKLMPGTNTFPEDWIVTDEASLPVGVREAVSSRSEMRNAVELHQKLGQILTKWPEQVRRLPTALWMQIKNYYETEYEYVKDAASLERFVRNASALVLAAENYRLLLEKIIDASAGTHPPNISRMAEELVSKVYAPFNPDGLTAFNRQAALLIGKESSAEPEGAIARSEMRAGKVWGQERLLENVAAFALVVGVPALVLAFVGNSEASVQGMAQPTFQLYQHEWLSLAKWAFGVSIISGVLDGVVEFFKEVSRGLKTEAKAPMQHAKRQAPGAKSGLRSEMRLVPSVAKTETMNQADTLGTKSVSTVILFLSSVAAMVGVFALVMVGVLALAPMPFMVQANGQGVNLTDLQYQQKLLQMAASAFGVSGFLGVLNWVLGASSGLSLIPRSRTQATKDTGTNLIAHSFTEDISNQRVVDDTNRTLAE